jgi:acyl-CoA reductase-like NAD-dependent aldehyde dehydrogenase
MESDNARRQRPDWEMLPPRTRQALTDLMARLILDHKEEERDLLPRETRHDV